jgi:hypothetical protein
MQRMQKDIADLKEASERQAKAIDDLNDSISLIKGRLGLPLSERMKF